MLIEKVLDGLLDKEKIKQLIIEFDDRKTKEALFAYQCDKLECDIQSKIYDEENCVNLNEQQSNKSFKNELVSKLLEEEKTWSGMWIAFGQKKYGYDQNFTSVSNYAKNNSIKSLIEN